MKFEISRNSHKPNKRYSGVYQQQGRMITDADWNESVDIQKTALSEALGDVVGSGVPKEGGIEIIPTGNTLKIKPGRLYADGKAAVFPGKEDELVDFSNQEDYPNPGLSGLEVGKSYAVYADVWDREVTAIEDPSLVDEGLGGVDTCARTKRMVQIKLAPIDVNVEKILHNPTKNHSDLLVIVNKLETIVSNEDPCERLSNYHEDTNNYLFRLEVHNVEREFNNGSENPEDNRYEPTKLSFKWSLYNATELYPIDDKNEVQIENKAVEQINEVDFLNLGINFFPLRQNIKALTNTIEDGVEYFRIWDGYGEVDVKNKKIIKSIGLHEIKYDIDGSGIRINLREKGVSLFLSLISKNNITNQFVRGDYWQHDFREYGKNRKYSVINSGIEHGYLFLGEINVQLDGSKKKLYWDAKDLSFPSVSELTARDILINQGGNCSEKYKSLEDVVKGYCELDAGKIPLGTTPPFCEELTKLGASSIQDALFLMCSARVSSGWITIDPKELSRVLKSFSESSSDNIKIRLKPGVGYINEPVSVRGKKMISISGVGVHVSKVYIRHSFILQSTQIVITDFSVRLTRNRSVNLYGEMIDCRNMEITKYMFSENYLSEKNLEERLPVLRVGPLNAKPISNAALGDINIVNSKLESYAAKMYISKSLLFDIFGVGSQENSVSEFLLEIYSNIERYVSMPEELNKMFRSLVSTIEAWSDEYKKEYFVGVYEKLKGVKIDGGRTHLSIYTLLGGYTPNYSRAETVASSSGYFYHSDSAVAVKSNLLDYIDRFVKTQLSTKRFVSMLINCLGEIYPLKAMLVKHGSVANLKIDSSTLNGDVEIYRATDFSSFGNVFHLYSNGSKKGMGLIDQKLTDRFSSLSADSGRYEITSLQTSSPVDKYLRAKCTLINNIIYSFKSGGISNEVSNGVLRYSTGSYETISVRDNVIWGAGSSFIADSVWMDNNKFILQEKYSLVFKENLNLVVLIANKLCMVGMDDDVLIKYKILQSGASRKIREKLFTAARQLGAYWYAHDYVVGGKDSIKNSNRMELQEIITG